ncbi:MAG: PAS domain S-box protein, partial [Bacteroidota bacterium]
RQSGFVIATIGALVWGIVEVLARSVDVSSLAVFWNLLVRYGFFLITVILIAHIKSLNVRLTYLLEEITAGWAQEVAERKRTEWELAKSSQEFRTLISDLNDAYYILNPEGRFTYASPFLIEKSGYTEQELLGMSYVRLIASEDRKRIVRYYKSRTASRDLEATCKFRVRTKRGELIWVEQTTRMVRDKENRVIEYHNIVRDIREEKRREEQLLLLAYAVASTSQMISITDEENRFIFVNQAFTSTYGYSHDEIYGKKPDVIFSDKNDPLLIKQIQEHTKAGGWNGELFNKKKDGTEFRIALTTSPIKNKYGHTVGLLGVATDVTEKYAAQETIKRSEAQFRTLVETIPQGLVRVDTNNRIQYVNNQFCTMTGYTREEMIQQEFDKLFIRERDFDFFQSQRIQRERGSIGSYEIQLKKKSGDLLWVQVNASPMTDSTGAYIGALGIITDISDRQRIETTLIRAEAKLHQLFDTKSQVSEVLEEIEFPAHESLQLFEGVASRLDNTIREMEKIIKRVLSFSSMSAHELRTPLAIIRNQLEATMDTHLTHEQVMDNLNLVYDETLKLRSTVDQLLAIGSMLAGTLTLELEPIEMHSFLAAFHEESLFLTYDKNISVNFVNVPSVKILANEFMLRRALFNLLDNAIKFSPVNGTINIHSVLDQQSVVIQITDTGTGISLAEAEHIFDPFWRGRNVGGVGGTGLGLALVQLVIEAHHGTIKVCSDENKGTTFTIALPVYYESSNSAIS